jgi:hypothetical protein
MKRFLLLFVLLGFMVMTSASAQASYITFTGYVDNPSVTYSLPGVSFEDGAAANGYISFTPNATDPINLPGTVEAFWIDVDKVGGGTYRFEIPGEIGEYNPTTFTPIAGDGIYFVVDNGPGHFMEFEWYAPGYDGFGQTSQWLYQDFNNQFSLHGFAPTVVPIPGALWLLSSGILAFAGLRKKLSF